MKKRKNVADCYKRITDQSNKSYQILYLCGLASRAQSHPSSLPPQLSHPRPRPDDSQPPRRRRSPETSASPLSSATATPGRLQEPPPPSSITSAGSAQCRRVLSSDWTRRRCGPSSSRRRAAAAETAGFLTSSSLSLSLSSLSSFSVKSPRIPLQRERFHKIFFFIKHIINLFQLYF